MDERHLTDRRQRVIIGDVFSTWKEVLSDTPQGSCLSPLLFIIYINDMPDALEHFSKLFADDSKIIAVFDDFYSILELFNQT